MCGIFGYLGNQNALYIAQHYKGDFEGSFAIATIHAQHPDAMIAND